MYNVHRIWFKNENFCAIGTASTIGPTASAVGASAKPAATALSADEDDLSARLARLREN